jgi:hypothetical protein
LGLLLNSAGKLASTAMADMNMLREAGEVEDMMDEADSMMELNPVTALTVGNVSDLDRKLAELDAHVVKCIKQVKAWNRLFANVMDVTKQPELAVLINKLKEDTKNYKVEMVAKKETLMPVDVLPAVSQPGAGGGPGQADQLLQVIRRKDDKDRRCRDEWRQLQMVTKYEQVRSVCS